MKNLSKVLVIISLIVLNPVIVNSAEILQINSSNTILVGDQNRILTIRLFCVDVNETDEFEAINLLKGAFPRGSKVKINPFGLKDNIEMTELLASENLNVKNSPN